MENQNILTIKFNTLDDLAVQVADWHERLNHQCCGNCSETSDASMVEVRPANGKSLELAEEALNAEFKKCVEREQSDKKDVKKVAKEQTSDDIPVQPLDAEPVEPKEERTPQQEVVEPKDEPAQEVESTLDVTAEPIDKKAFYKEFRAWMGEDGVKAKKAIAVFGKHGVTRPSSDSLTDDLITDLKSIMAEKEA